MRPLVGSGSSSRGKKVQQNPNTFETFLEGWLVRQEHYLDELISAGRNCTESTDEDLLDLIARVLSHYQQYYEHKSIAVQQNVFRLFSPSYFSSLERSFLWVAGFKPGLALKLVSSAVTDLSEEQGRKLQQLADETRIEERGLADDLAKIQESIAAPPVLEVVRRTGREEGNMAAVAAAMETVRAGLESVVANADLLRTATAAKVAEILSPAQNVRFFTAVTQLQVNVRRWGLRRDGELQPAEESCWKKVDGHGRH